MKLVVNGFHRLYNQKAITENVNGNLSVYRQRSSVVVTKTETIDFDAVVCVKNITI